MTTALRVLVADDEAIARNGLSEVLASCAGVEVVGEAADGAEASRLTRALKPDALFLDIQMPALDGFGVMESLAQPPAFVFVTAFEQYALPAFEANAADYLLKPFDARRVERAVERVRRFMDTGGSGGATHTAWKADGSRFVVKDRGTITFVEHDEIDWIESWGNYVRLFIGGRAMLLRESMAGVEAKLDPGQFVRISRGAIVNAGQVRRLLRRPNGQVDVGLNNGLLLRASRRHRQRLQEFFGVRQPNG